MEKNFKVVLIAAILGGLLVGGIGSFFYYYFQDGLGAEPENEAHANALPPSTGLESTSHGNLTIYRDPAEAFRAAKEERKPVFLDFFADWCTNCVKFQDRMIQDPSLNQALQSSIVLKVDEEDSAFSDYARDGRFKEINEALPLFAVLDSSHELVWKGQDYLDSKSMIQALQEAARRSK